MDFHDDDISHFAAYGTPPLPEADAQGHVAHDGARIWYAAYGAGPPVILLHGGLGHGGNWSYQVPALTQAGYRAVLIDSRGHGRSTRDARPLAYETMASDVPVVMDALGLEAASFVGWSDGAIVSLIVAMAAPSRVRCAFFFGGNMDTSGVREITWPHPILERCLSRHARDYASLSATPAGFMPFALAVQTMMKTQPNYTASDLAAIRVPVAIVQAEHEEFIKPEHADYLARTIPGADMIVLPGVSHFAPLQRPAQFNEAMRVFLDKARS